MALDLSSLEKAVGMLKKAVDLTSPENLAAMTEDQQDLTKAGVIQYFEFTYELCWKFMKRWLEMNMGAVYVDGVTRRELFRLSAESGLISDVEQWMDYHHARNETSHTYARDTAEEIFQTAKTFLADAQTLLEHLEEKND